MKPGYDVMIEAEAGLMYITGEENGTPVKVGVAVTGSNSAFHARFLFISANTALADPSVNNPFGPSHLWPYPRSDNRSIRSRSNHGRLTRTPQNRTRPTH